jgi:hypothetical protein
LGYASKNNILVDPDYCKKLAWASMQGTPLFEQVLTTEQQEIYGNTGAIEQGNMRGAKGKQCVE